MQLTSNAFADNEPIPERFALGKMAAEKHAEIGEDINPPLAWSDLPEGTRSLVLICRDPDVPTVPQDLNREDTTIPRDLPRTNFYHWVLVDLPPAPNEIRAGEFSDGPVPHGKNGPEGPRGTRQGINNYTQFFSGKRDMEGKYFGYDGPFPPVNDSIMHRYYFTLYALDVDECPVDGTFSGPDVEEAIQGHVLDSATLVGLYSLNPAVATRQ